ncbi:cryptochrome/photolyase family protein [Betaproteobacteria bacterium LSUCC0115]|nr:cryptochrome/photolyase family protein [Burkholderiales bacterium LSUCC0115]
MTKIRHLVLILGDQLDHQGPALSGFDNHHDVIWMAEVAEESEHVPSSKIRTALFLSAMRHFAKAQQELGRTVQYVQLDDPDNTQTLAGELARTLKASAPERVVMTEPGDYRVLKAIEQCAADQGCTLRVLADSHFVTSLEEFKAHAKGRKQLRLEYFYREVRHTTGLLMQGSEPVGGQWNFDVDNRGAFGKEGPGLVPPPVQFAPDEITQDVIGLVDSRFKGHVGDLSHFNWPVSRAQALEALQAFVRERLPLFGRYQDAMWSGQAWLYHSHLSSSLNLKLISPLEVAQAAEQAYQREDVPIEAAEGFIRQVIGWREYVRGLYWLKMPGYADLNELGADQPLPSFYWSGQTDMACMRDALDHTLRLGYSHHIQRLMVTGLYALLFGVRPKAIHEWYLSVYVDAVEWVELPNTLGMSQFADGGQMASKPYAASGAYIDRMSNHCNGCRYKPKEKLGPSACPFTTLYWDFLIRHKDRLAKNPRMVMQIKNVNRLDQATQGQISLQANEHRASVLAGA